MSCIVQYSKSPYWTIGHLLYMQKKKKKNLDTDFIPFTKIKSKWSTHPSIKCKTTKLLENNRKKISMTSNLVMTF